MEKSQQAPALKRLLTVKEAADYLSLSEQYLRNRIAKTALSPFPVRPKRIGGAVRFDIEDLSKFVDSL